MFLLLLVSLFTPSLGLRGVHLGLPPPPVDKAFAPEEQWFLQTLDHFASQPDDRVWIQRFWENLDHYVEGGPAFIMIGGEGEASPGWLNYGQWADWAKEQGAAMFLLEHRFYGNSKPTEDMSTPNLVYLSSRQALEDLGAFLNEMNYKHNLTGGWVTFGGSYPGSLSAWMSLKFPDMVIGSVSSSGPVLAQLDFHEYLEVVEAALDTTGPDCNPALTRAMIAAEEMVKNEADWGLLSSLFTTCEPFDGNNQMDVKSFIELLIDNLAGIVQYNGRFNEDIFSICAVLTDTNLGEPIERLAIVNTMMLSMNGEECLDYTYETFLSQLTDVSFSGVGVGWRPWVWQTCTEFGWYQTTNQENMVYGSTLDIGFFEQWCRDAFGSDMFTHDILEANVAASNVEYGGLSPAVDNVVFVHGTIDPWHAMGVLEDLSPSCPSIVVTGTSHCADMYSNSATDPQEMLDARERIGMLVDGWVKAAKKVNDK